MCHIKQWGGYLPGIYLPIKDKTGYSTFVTNCRIMVHTPFVQKKEIFQQCKPFIWRNYCTSNIPFWSLKVLTNYLAQTYNSMININMNMNGLTPNQVVDIKKKILCGQYTFSPLQAFQGRREDIDKPFFDQRICVQLKDGITTYIGIKPTEEDNLVLTSLALMLVTHYNRNQIFKDYSLGCKGGGVSNYYDIVSNKGNVLQLFVIDLLKSSHTVDVVSLKDELSSQIKNPDIIALLQNFLKLPILGKDADLAPSLELKIPPAGLICDVLLNIALIKLDEQFHSYLPELDYIRYNNEVIVTIPFSLQREYKTISRMFEHQLFSLFDKLKLAGKVITIRPGDQPVPLVLCNDGKISLDYKGKIRIELNEIE